MGTTWRCPRCGSVTVIAAKAESEVIAVYDLCRSPDEPRGTRVPVRMERVVEPAEMPPAPANREPALAR
ncbi:MAG: hypothetical protein Q8R78_04520 [Candidatus Omnitrophota bacterium]|nr:hypothetical protein [Candidatus Omnitrophota bacterium]